MTAPPAAGIVLPRLLLVTSGSGPASGWEIAVRTLLRGTSLQALVAVAASEVPPLAIDLDSIAGLAADEAAAEFVVGTLGVRVVMTRRAALAPVISGAGGLCLVRVNALDSTGMARTLTVPPAVQAGTAVSPGLAVPHLPRAERDRLGRPLVAYGLIRTPEEAETVFDSGVTTIAARPDNPADRRWSIWAAGAPVTAVPRSSA
ncbi:MAG: glycerol-3-phosphate responsive antiterminator [Candidatus Dormibacteraceae bacterium]